MAQNLQSAVTLPCPYCRRPLRASARARVALFRGGFECDRCGPFPDTRLIPYSAQAGAREAPGNRRDTGAADRRAIPRGGRRTTDVPGRYPPVLVGDSDEGARRVFARGLERFGFQVIEAATGEEALAHAEEYGPLVVIAESTLPRDDGLQEYIRSNRVPYIVTVTNSDALAPPDAAAVLEKPFPLMTLLHEVFRVLRTGHAPAAA